SCKPWGSKIFRGWAGLGRTAWMGSHTTRPVSRKERVFGFCICSPPLQKGREIPLRFLAISDNFSITIISKNSRESCRSIEKRVYIKCFNCEMLGNVGKWLITACGEKSEKFQ